MSIEETRFFREALLNWHKGHLRPLPWKGEQDPYRIWLSEIILQQTRVEQGQPYYERMVTAYPTVHHLAEAPLDDVLKHWEGLGYYSRARNLHTAARQIVSELGGTFPNTFEEIRALKGVGDYTAAAIASFAFNLPYAVLDSNVYRVLARFWGIETPINTAGAQKQFLRLAQQLLDPKQPGAYNQALMDFGARLCRPRQPLCEECPLATRCVAFQQNRIEELPRKKPLASRQERFFLYAVFLSGDAVWVQQRPNGDIWALLYEFALWETAALPEEPVSMATAVAARFLPTEFTPVLENIDGPYRQVLSHRVVHALFYVYVLGKEKQPPLQNARTAPDGRWVSLAEVEKKLPLPKIIAQFLKRNVLPCSKNNPC